MEYTLSYTLIVDGPVRALAYLPSGALISGSESGVITCFPLLSSSCSSSGKSGTSFTLPSNGDSTRHPHHITALISVPSQHGLSGGYVSGCKDCIIRVFNSSHEQVAQLRGHEKAVTSLSWLFLCSSTTVETDDLDVQPTDPLLLSGSWDGTAKIWNIVNQEGIVTWSCLATLSGHENTVCVQGLVPPISSPNSATDSNNRGVAGHLVTTSAGIASENRIRDHAVRFWEVTIKHLTPVVGYDTASCMVELKCKIANDHDGPIRGVTIDEESGRVFTCSNDGTVKVRKGWDAGDACMGSCLTTLSFTPHGISPPMLLSVACLEKSSYSKDRGIVVCAEDGTVVVWSESTLEPQMILHPNCVWTVLPLPDGDFATACHDGMVRIFSRNPGKVASVEELSAFHEAVEEARAKRIGGGGPTPEEIAKLPKWENNYSVIGSKEGAVHVFNKAGYAIAAQWSQASRTWIEVGEVTGSTENAGTINGKHYDHILPIEVDVPGGGLKQLQIGYNNGDNPFVSAQNFINEHMLDQFYLAQIADYIRSRVGHQANATRTIGEESLPIDLISQKSSDYLHPASIPFQHLPIKGYLCFESGADKQTLEKVCTKIREFNTSLNNNLPPADVIDCLNNLCATIMATSRYHASSVTDHALKMVHKMIKEWNLIHIFPALDLARLVVLHPDAAKGNRQNIWTDLIDVTVERCLELKNCESSVSASVPMLSFRLFANAFRGGPGSSNAVVFRIESILELMEAHVLSMNKNTRLAVATFLLNLSSFQNASLGHAPVDTSSFERVIPLCKTILESNLYESESIVRVLIALGTSLLTNPSFKQKVKAMGIQIILKAAKSDYSENVRSVCDEVLLLL